MKTAKPIVSIGLPIYNGENFIKESLDSILAQTFTDFELIISDNASTDQTEDICREYAAKDKRIRYYRNQQNLGAAKNFNLVFELSSGEYFKWAAHDDIIAPNFLQKAVEVLDRDPSIVLCHSKVKFINEVGQIVKDYEDVKKIYKFYMNNLKSPKPEKRFGDLILVDHWALESFALMRSDVLKKTSLIGSYVGSDRVLLAHLSLLGRFHEIDEYLFFSRDHQERSIKKIPLHLRAEWFDSTKNGKISLTHWKLFIEYWKCLNCVTLSIYARMCCYMYIIFWLFLYSKKLSKDLIIVFRGILFIYLNRQKNHLKIKSKQS